MACLPGTFKSALAMLACSACPGTSTSPPSSSAQEDCVRSAGFYHDYLSDAPSFMCAVCTVGSWCPGQRAMHPCTDHSLSDPGATSREDCVCESSKFKQDEICFDCPLDSYCPGDNNKHACPGHSAALERSQALSDCICDGGFEKQ